MDDRTNVLSGIFGKAQDAKDNAHDILAIVYKALEEKGYDPISQLSEYLISGDPTYITTHNDARRLISLIDRDELLQDLIKAYLGKDKEQK